jgi:diguanylate cyclase (GGDEF)-like protein
LANSLTPLARGYLGCVYGMGTVALVSVLATARWGVPQQSHGVLVVMVVLLMVGEFFPIRLWRRGSFQEYTFSGTFALALLASAPIVYAVLAQLAALLIEELRQRKAARAVAFNLAQYTLMFVLARLAVCAVDGIAFNAYTNVPPTRQLLSLVVAAPVFFLVNAVLTGTVIALTRSAPVLAGVIKYAREEIPITPIVLGLAPLVIGCLQFSIWTAPLCLLPIVAVRRAATIAAEHEVAALHDPLTGLPNRTLLMERLRQALDEARHQSRPVGLLMLDLDHFKEINDTLGHPVGDELLRLVAARLTDALRPGDTVARLGGDEFAVVVPDATAQTASHIAQRVATSLSEAFRLVEVSLNVEASVGIAVSPDHGRDAESLIRYADVALYTAKQSRGAHAIYDPQLDEHSVERLALMGELRQGIQSGELVVYYQPKVSVRSGRLVGVEALVRWRHPTLGLLSPARFIPAAENTGLIEPLTEWVIDEALAAARRWREEGLYLSVAVNVSARHITNLNLPGQIKAALAKHELPAETLVVEVTESCLMADPMRTRIVLGQLRQAGVAVSIDDFGTGYSSFANLRDLPVTEIKIDRSFVAATVESTANTAIVKSTIELGHNLGLEVVAEGVESQPCLDILTAMGCDLVQGYLFAPPIPSADLPGWAAARAEIRHSDRITTAC